MKKLNALIVPLLVAGLVMAGCKKKSGPTGPEEGNPGNNPYAGTVLYIYSNEGGNYDIYTLSLDDGTLTKVIGTSADEKYPFVFGNKIYFAANDDGDYDIYVANLDGSGRTKVTNYPNDEVEPVVSPDGKYLAFTWGTAGNLKVALYDLQNGDTVKTFGLSGKVNLSPEFVGNDTLLMTLQDYGSAYSQDPWIYIISADTLINLPGDKSLQEGHWRVKGGKVVYSRMGLYAENPRIAVANFPTFGSVQDVYSHSIRSIRPVWSPDGAHIAVSHEGICLIVMVNSSGGGTVDTLYQKGGSECYTYATWK